MMIKVYAKCKLEKSSIYDKIMCNASMFITFRELVHRGDMQAGLYIMED